jgi:hypothetical protein
MNDDDLPEAIGYHYTHWDCPLCDCANEEEGDVKSERCICIECGAQVRITP